MTKRQELDAFVRGELASHDVISGRDIGKSALAHFGQDPQWLLDFATECLVEYVDVRTKRVVQEDKQKVFFGAYVVPRASVGSLAAQAASRSGWWSWREPTGQGTKPVLEMTLEELDYAIGYYRAAEHRAMVRADLLQDIRDRTARKRRRTPAAANIETVLDKILTAHGMNQSTLGVQLEAAAD